MEKRGKFSKLELKH